MPYALWDPMARGLSGRFARAGSTYAMFRQNSIIRAQGIVPNPRSPDQIAIRSLFTAAASGWQGLTDENRDNWDAWAAAHPATNRLGNIISRTGLSAYVQFYTVAAVTGATVPANGPTLPRPSAPTGIGALLVSGGPTNITFDVDHNYSTLTGLWLLARQTPAITSPAVTPPLNQYRLIEGVSTNSNKPLDTSGDSYNFTAARFDAIEDDRMGIGVSIVNAEGWESEIFFQVLVVTT